VGTVEHHRDQSSNNDESSFRAEQEQTSLRHSYYNPCLKDECEIRFGGYIPAREKREGIQLGPNRDTMLPPHRISIIIQKTSKDIWERRGDSRGACDQEFHSIHKVVSSSLRQQAQTETLDAKSPRYDLIKNLKLTDL
jgi:hypothetical protein